ncbi:MAG: glutamate synthase [Acidobacteria bacterium]|nr:glutamate synthase [Acidobacteriota bacterium]
MTTTPAPFATTPPPGLPELKEHDACALAAFATRDGKPSRDIIDRALLGLDMMVHRAGSVDGEGDGSGLQVDLPRPLWASRLAAEGLDPATADDPRFVVAHVFFEGGAEADEELPRLIDIARLHGFEVLVSREGEIDRTALGPRAAENPPVFWQLALLAGDAATASRDCYRAMVAIEQDLTCHVASFSANDCVYKVLGQPMVLPAFFPELADPAFGSSRVIAHNRYSTNTYPTFSRVQPFAILGHNGEINTIAQLREQCRQLGLPITRDGSDSQDLNRLLEGLIFEKGLSLIEAVEFAFPPILGEVHRLPSDLQDLYVHYREAWGPYAQGPVALAARAYDEMVFSVDALGLRPLWWVETADIYVASSEPGIIPVHELTADPRPLAPGEKIALISGGDGVPQVLSYPEVQREVHARASARGGLPHAEARARLAGGLEPVGDGAELEPATGVSEVPLADLLASAGWIDGDKQQVQFHADRGAEPIGSLGWDGPLGPLSPVALPVSDYLQETVAVVTNPAIDREREVEHFSTRVVLGRRPPIEGVEHEPPQRCELRMPIILGAMRPSVQVSLPELRRVAAGQGVAVMEDVIAAWGDRYARLPLYYPTDGSTREHVARLCEMAVDAVSAGAEIVVLEDRLATAQERVIDPHLAVAAVDKALREAHDDEGVALRRRVSVVLKAVGIRNVHDIMVAVGFGADALCPYAMVEQAVDGSPEPEAAAGRLLDGLQKGMEKVLSTLGIHEIRGYGRLVSAIGIAPEVLDRLGIPGFCASEGRGLDFARLDVLAEQGRQIRAGEEGAGKVKLPRMYPKVWKALARVANSERGYDEFAETCQALEDEQPVALRHAIGIQLAPEGDRLPADRVSSAVGDQDLPFVISSMSFGSQGETPFRAYAEAAYRANMLCMNGEGGEIRDMYGKYPRNRGVQIASGRFGVSSLLMNACEWIEIKIGQGAKPGEGGHLPGSKVTEAIAAARNATVGSDLISPSNNHDLYSIEDLAQLIDELKTANPYAKVIVKVPVVPGVGTIAVGIAKAGADVLTLSGFDGGTGAARLHALRRAGLPCEIGTVLAHHALVEAGIRDRVEIWADGGLRTAADAIKLICLGANRLGYGTAAMVAIGCTICRGCQLDTCHVGIATQLDEEEAEHRGLKRFVPREYEPAVEGLMRYFTEMGEAMRRIVGEMGVDSVQDLVGQADRLAQITHHSEMDLDGLLTPTRERVIGAPEDGERYFRPFTPPPPHRARDAAEEALEAATVLAVEESELTARDRNLGTDLAGVIARARTGLHTPLELSAQVAKTAPEGHAGTLVDLQFTDGAATGSGLAAFNVEGVRIRVSGGAQDGVGKCSLGGEVQVLKALTDSGEWVGGHVGKSFAYGAQRGLFLIQGDADARAGIRLSGADMVLGGEPSGPIDDRIGALGARANCKGFAFEYMTGGRAVVLGDPGPWLCSGMTGGVVYVRQEADWNLDEAAIRRRLSKAAKVSMVPVEPESEDAQNITELLGAYCAALAASGQDGEAARLAALVECPGDHFIAIHPVTQQADPNLSTE